MIPIRPPAPGHVVDDEDGIAGYVFAHVAAHDAGVNVVAAAGRERNDNAYHFAFEKGLLGVDEIAQRKCYGENERQGYNLSHAIASSSFLPGDYLIFEPYSNSELFRTDNRLDRLRDSY